MKINNIILVLRTRVILLSSFVIYFFCICHWGSFPIIIQHMRNTDVMSQYVHCCHRGWVGGWGGGELKCKINFKMWYISTGGPHADSECYSRQDDAGVSSCPTSIEKSQPHLRIKGTA